ncbi:septal ring lytic transglycosylase RlpA family protein [Nocardiopsis kunsanensis]|uniref:septal ring lytic transglycosylase RlpA family protein n=1 Tax=Nocardiopsis kunsanensis TaxID=141693 RepID=UPI0003494FA4|nr:septal ring lytic transglycosylase RlpA family protein [Nocardiopsis kunsanensis]
MDTHHTDHTRPTTPGPRRAATRRRKKRALLTASATGAALLIAGTATAAVITTRTPPEHTTQAATIPPATTNPLHTDTGTEPDTDHPPPHEPPTTSAQGPTVTQEPEPETPQPTDTDQTSGRPTGESGTCQASFYGDGFHGSTTANGETFDTYAMTAAHKTLPFDTMVEVTNPTDGRSATVRINDRGPYIDGRCLDLSTAAFDQVIGTGSGVGTVQWHVLE